MKKQQHLDERREKHRVDVALLSERRRSEASRFVCVAPSRAGRVALASCEGGTSGDSIAQRENESEATAVTARPVLAVVVVAHCDSSQLTRCASLVDAVVCRGSREVSPHRRRNQQQQQKERERKRMRRRLFTSKRGTRRRQQ